MVSCNVLTQRLYILVISNIRTTCPTHQIFLPSSIVWMCYTEYNREAPQNVIVSILLPPSASAISFLCNGSLQLPAGYLAVLFSCSKVVTHRTGTDKLTKTFRKKVVPPKLRAVRSDTASRLEASKFCLPHFLPNISFDINK